MENFAALPILIPLTAAALIALVPWDMGRRMLSLISTLSLVAVSIVLLIEVKKTGFVVLQAGNWPAPFGISLVADALSALMVAISAVVGLTCAIYSLGDVGKGQQEIGFHIFFQVLLAGVNGAFLSGDLFNIFVWFEVMLMASFVLVSSGGRASQLGGGIKYMALNFLASGLFLTALGLVYGKMGTLNLADLGDKLASISDKDVLLPVAVLLFVAFGLKAGLFPLYSWLPASYHTPLPTVSAVFAGLLTKVGVYTLIRVFTLVFPIEGTPMVPILLWLSLATMVTGVFGAATQMDARRILSFHIISQIGYMTAGLAIGGVAGLAAAVFYTIHHIAVKTNLFFVAGTLEHIQGTGALDKLGGLWRKAPFLCVLFLIPAFSLAGIPPLSGFWAKLLILQGAIGLGWYVTAAIALAVGIFTLYSMTKIWNEAFWKNPTRGEVTLRHAPVSLIAASVLLGLLTVFFSLAPQFLMDWAELAAKQLSQPELYIHHVLGGEK